MEPNRHKRLTDRRRAALMAYIASSPTCQRTGTELARRHAWWCSDVAEQIQSDPAFTVSKQTGRTRAFMVYQLAEWSL